MQLTPDKAGKWQLAIAMPLQEIQFSDVQRLSRTTVARNDVDCQIVPGGRTARGYNLPALIRKNDVWLGNKVYLREAPTKEIRVAPVACCRFAVEQAGCRQQHRTRTRRIDRVAGAMALAEPFLQFVWRDAAASMPGGWLSRGAVRRGRQGVEWHRRAAGAGVNFPCPSSTAALAHRNASPGSADTEPSRRNRTRNN